MLSEATCNFLFVFLKGVGIVDILYVVRPRRAALNILGCSSVALVFMYCNLVSFASKLWKRPGELNNNNKKKRKQNPKRNNTRSVYIMQNTFCVDFFIFWALENYVSFCLTWYLESLNLFRHWVLSNKTLLYYQILQMISPRN